MRASVKFDIQLCLLVWIFPILTISVSTDLKNKKIQISYGSRIVLGGLFPIHSNSHSDDDDHCGEMLTEKGIQRLEAMLYAIDEINKNYSYWQFRLGATILDTCSSESYALEQSLQFLHYSCGPSANISRKVTAVIGAANSQVSASVANIFRLFQIPQVSYASTSQELDDLYKYPYFFRVVPSDRFQVGVILDILLEFRWTFISMVVSKGEYGERAAQGLRELIRNETHDEICIATVEVLPRDAEDADYNTVIRRLDKHDRAKVVIVFLNEDKISLLLEAIDRCNIPNDRFVWLGSDGWGAKDRIVEKRKEIAHGAITILPKRFPVKGFDGHFKALKPRTNTRNVWFEEFWENKFNCIYKRNSLPARRMRRICTGDENLSETYQQEGLVPMVIDSVQLLAVAIKTLCTDHPSFCINPQNMEMKYRDLLVDIIEKTAMESVQGNDMRITFDKARSIPVNYTIFQYSLLPGSDDEYAYKPIGEWNPDKKLRLVGVPKWKTTEGKETNRRPASSCSEECNAGEERITNHEFLGRCCWTCRPCDDLYYLPEPNLPCQKCPEGTVPSKNKKSCREYEATYVGQYLGSPWALVPMVFSVLGLICTVATFVIFFVYRNTPIIMASGRELCYVILVGILFCYIFPFIVLLKPSKISCGSLRIGMGLGLAICYSAIFTKTNRLSRIFEVSLKSIKRPSYISPESQIIICVCLVLIQLTLTVLWLIIKPPQVHQKLLTHSNMFWIIYCPLDSVSVLLGLLYNMILLILCTIYAYKTRNIPENFNETKWISFTMYASCIVWCAFILIYSTAMQDYMIESTILSMSVSINGTVTLVCIFVPKIYVVLFRPERNIRYPGSSGTSGTGTCDSGQAVRYLRNNAVDRIQPSLTDSPFFVIEKKENNCKH